MWEELGKKKKSGWLINITIFCYFFVVFWKKRINKIKKIFIVILIPKYFKTFFKVLLQKEELKVKQSEVVNNVNFSDYTIFSGNL